MGTGFNIDTAYSGLQAAQAGLLVTSQNVAGTSVDGFNRRNANVVIDGLASNSIDLTGTHFAVEGFTRDYSALLGNQINDQGAKSAMSDTLVQTTSTLNTVLVNQATSLSSALDAFFNAAGALVADPTNPSLKADLVGKSGQLAARLASLSQTVDTVKSDAQSGLVGAKDDANNLASQLGAINAKIVSATASGNTSPSADLLDQRDRLMAQIQADVGGQSIINEDGTASVFVAGQPLVERANVGTLVLDGSGNNLSLVPAAADGKPAAQKLQSTVILDRNQLTSGKAGAYVKLLNDFIPAMQNGTKDAQGNTLTPGLNTLADQLVSNVTVISSQDHTTALPLFKFGAATGPGAANSASNIVATQLDPSSWEISAAAAQTMESSRTGYVDSVSSIVTSAGNRIAQWESDQAADKAISAQLDTERQAVSGVNLDEEAANMVKYQQLYSASSRVLQTGSQLFNQLISMLTSL